MTTPQARENRASARFDIVALGEAMIEFNEARDGDSRTWLQGFGGDTSNMVVAAARLGARCAYVTRVGSDDFGRRLVALWNCEGVSTEGVAVDEDAPTGVVLRKIETASSPSLSARCWGGTSATWPRA